MGIINLQAKLKEGVNKFKFPLLILAVGMFFMIMPTIEKKQQKNDTVIFKEETETVSDEERLTDILNKIHGAGDVAVMLTTATGEETIYQTNDNQSTSADTSNNNADTVLVTDSQRNEMGLVRQKNPARYLGAVVVCTGADDPVVRLAMVDAVSKATGLGANQISVLKMK